MFSEASLAKVGEIVTRLDHHHLDPELRHFLHKALAETSTAHFIVA